MVRIYVKTFNLYICVSLVFGLGLKKIEMSARLSQCDSFLETSFLQ